MMSVIELEEIKRITDSLAKKARFVEKKLIYESNKES